MSIAEHLLTKNTICFYDKTKGAVDVVDMETGKYITIMKTKRWSISSFTYVLDTCITNANTIFREATGKS